MNILGLISQLIGIKTLRLTGTTDELDVATAVLVATTIPTLENLQMKNRD